MKKITQLSLLAVLALTSCKKDKAETGKVDLQGRIQMVAFSKKLRTIQHILCQSFSGYYLDNDS